MQPLCPRESPRAHIFNCSYFRVGKMRRNVRGAHFQMELIFETVMVTVSGITAPAVRSSPFPPGELLDQFGSVSIFCLGDQYILSIFNHLGFGKTASSPKHFTQTCQDISDIEQLWKARRHCSFALGKCSKLTIHVYMSAWRLQCAPCNNNVDDRFTDIEPEPKCPCKKVFDC